MEKRRDRRSGRNPWLSIPAADYLGHMDSPDVDQLSILAGILRGALERLRPESLLVLGCSTGNGFEHIDPAVTRRVTGIDINGEYLIQLRDRFPRPAFDLTLRAQDVARVAFPAEAFDVAHCALLFEYVDWRSLLPRLARALRGGGTLSLVVQRPSPTVPAVTPSAFRSLRRLEPLFAFVDPDEVVRAARPLGLGLRRRHAVDAKQRKALLAMELCRNIRAT